MHREGQNELHRSGRDQFPNAGHVKWIVWMGLIIVGLILVAASVVFALKAAGMLPEEYTYSRIVIDSIVVPCAFYMSLLVVGVGTSLVENYVQNILTRRRR
ncbi:MAG TPA: hypothetical protein VGY58_01385 [Gemmataceae bacterium]|nr:hypothetical protein [Gemmataceae bacterium]